VLKPRAEVKRFKAGNVRVRGVEDVAAAVLEAEGLKRVAVALRRSGLVQVEEGQRVFGMHQLLQQAVGRELGWDEPCARMRRLLHARCGQFGDEEYIDFRLHSVMREVAAAAVVAVRRVKEEGEEAGNAWCSGMLMQLYGVVKNVYGHDAEFPLRVLAAAHRSLVADLLREEVMGVGRTSAGRRMTLRELVHAAPHVRHVIAQDPEFQANEDDVRAIREEMSKGFSECTAWDIVTVRRFDIGKCLKSQWGRSVRALLLTHLVRAHVQEEGGTTLPMHAVAAVPLIRDVAGLRQEHDLARMLRVARGLSLVDNGGGGFIVELVEEVEAVEGRRGDGGLVVGEQPLRAKIWQWHNLRGHEESHERIVDEIGEVYDGQAEGGDKWEAGLALGAACNALGECYFRNEKWKQSVAARDRALRLLLDTLGEQHVYTAVALASIESANNSSNKGKRNTQHGRALRIYNDTLGLHPSTLHIVIDMSKLVAKNGERKKAIEMLEQALHIFERTVGRKHPDAALAIYSMSVEYHNMGEFGKAEELGLEAEDIYTKTLGLNHQETKKARDNLSIIRKAKDRKGKILFYETWPDEVIWTE
jgi:tetratricopeptide (TPR) repeat protein